MPISVILLHCSCSVLEFAYFRLYFNVRNTIYSMLSVSYDYSFCHHLFVVLLTVTYVTDISMLSIL